MPTDERPIVVYVDDELTNLRVFEANFRQHYHLHTFSSGAAALVFLGEHPQQVAVVLSDQRMPEMTGVELLEQVRQLTPEAQRFIVTAYSDVSAMIDAVNRGQVNR